MSLPAPAVTDFGSLAKLKTSARANDPEAIRKVAQQFEAMFTQQLLKSARAAKLGDDVMGGQQTEFYQDLFDQQMASHLSSGKGLGLADVLVRQLQGMGVSTSSPSDTTLGLGDDASRLKIGARTPAASDTAGPAGHQPTGGAAAHSSGFVDEIRPHAEAAAKELGVPAEAIMAQAALETGWGRHVPRKTDGSSSHNYFGIKAHGWDGATVEKTTHEHLGGRMHRVTAEFRSYDSPAAAFKDYVSFLKSNPRYVEALKADDAAGFAQGLQQAGYATDPQYAAKLVQVANRVRIGGSATGLTTA